MANRLRVVFGGTLLDAQSWSIGFTMQLPSSQIGTPQDALAYANQAFDDFNTAAWSTQTSGAQALKTLVGPDANLAACRVYAYIASSRTADLIGASTRSPIAGTGGNSLPPQAAHVASLQTGYAGRHNAGRVYVPYTGAGVAANRAGINVKGVATSIANYLSLARTRQFAGGMALPVVSGADTTAANPITRVVVDNVIDTQRRRRDKVAPTAREGVNVIVG